MADPLVCYTIGYNYVTSSNQYFPCGTSDIDGASAQSCCYAGDYCMEDSICHYTRGGVTNGTGYYMAGCTDSSWQDPACPKQCTSEYGADIIYDPSDSEWRCCQSSENSLSCQDPSEFVVEGPAPDGLFTVLQLTMAVPSAAATTGIGSITSPSAFGTSFSFSPTTTKAPASPTGSSVTPTKHRTSSGLTVGAKAGIAVGVILGVIAVVAAFFLIRRYRNKSHHSFQKHKSSENDTPSLSLSANRNPNPRARMQQRPHSFADSAAFVATPRHTQLLAQPSPPMEQNPPSESEGPFSNAHSLALPSPPLEQNQRSSTTTSAFIAFTAPQSLVSPPLPTEQSQRQSLALPSPRMDRPRSDGGISFAEGIVFPAPRERYSGDTDATGFGAFGITTQESDVGADSGPFEMETQDQQLKYRMPYERPQSAQELEGTRVLPQEMDGGGLER